MWREKLLVFAEAVADFDKVEARAYSGSELFGGQQPRRQVELLPGTHHREYDSSIIVPELMHNPHTGHDAKEEEDQDQYKESNGKAEDGRSPVALVASHFCVLLPFFRV